MNNVKDKLMAERRLDADFTHQVLMGDSESSSIGGRVATGVASGAKSRETLEEKRRKDAELNSILESLERTLERLDTRIAELNTEIVALRKELAEETSQSEQAFGRMHELEDLIDEVEKNGLTDTNRNALQNALGEKAKDVGEDTILIALARAQIVEELHIGTEAYIRSEDIRAEVTEREAVRDKMIADRKAIASDPSISAEGRMRLANAALTESMLSHLASTEAAREGLKAETNSLAENVRDGVVDELNNNDDFSFDESSDLIVQPLAPLP